MTPNQFRAWRLKRNLSQQALSDAIGIGRRTAQNYESGATVPDLRTKLAMAAYEAGLKLVLIDPKEADAICAAHDSADSLRDRIRAALADGAATRSELIADLNENPQAVREAVSRLISDGIVKTAGDDGLLTL